MPSTEQRLTDLEIKSSYADDAIDQLSAVIVRQQRQIDALITELSGLREQLPGDGPARAFRSLRDDLPPHY